jgi:F0F1-type ATP synthase membrane subunit b/b'
VLPDDKLREEVKLLTIKMNAEELEKAIKYLQSIVGQTMEEALTNPLYDDDELTEEDKTAIAQGKEDIKAGRIHSLNEIKKQLGDLWVNNNEIC